MAGWSNDDFNPTRKLESVAKGKAEILSRMNLLETIQLKFKGVIFGGPGTGKTVGAIKAAKALVQPEAPIVLYIDTGENWASMLNHPELMKNVMRYQFSSWDDNVQLMRWIHSGEAPFDKVGAIVFDEYNTMCEYDLAWITTQRSEAAMKDEKKYRDPYFPQRPDYLAMMHRSNIMLDALIKIDKHLIFISHSAVDKETGWLEPDLSPATRKGLMRRFHLVAYAYMDGKAKGADRYKYRITPLEQQRISAKGRIGRLGDTATMPQIIDAYKLWGKPMTNEAETGEEILEGHLAEVDETLVPEPVTADDLLDAI